MTWDTSSSKEDRHIRCLIYTPASDDKGHSSQHRTPIGRVKFPANNSYSTLLGDVREKYLPHLSTNQDAIRALVNFALSIIHTWDDVPNDLSKLVSEHILREKSQAVVERIGQWERDIESAKDTLQKVSMVNDNEALKSLCENYSEMADKYMAEPYSSKMKDVVKGFMGG